MDSIYNHSSRIEVAEYLCLCITVMLCCLSKQRNNEVVEYCTLAILPLCNNSGLTLQRGLLGIGLLVQGNVEHDIHHGLVRY